MNGLFDGNYFSEDIYNWLSIIMGQPTSQKAPLNYHKLEHGITLNYLEIEDNQSHYGLLFRNGKKLSDIIFRVGGMGGSFKDNPYCMLIEYGNFHSALKTTKAIKSLGNHCIIDANGKIVLTQEKGALQGLYYLKGCIAVSNNYYYNLITGEIITKGDNTITSNEFLFIENRYSNLYGTDKGKYQLGVYKVNWITGEYELFK